MSSESAACPRCAAPAPAAASDEERVRVSLAAKRERMLNVAAGLKLVATLLILGGLLGGCAAHAPGALLVVLAGLATLAASRAVHA